MMAVWQCPTCHGDVRIPQELFGSLVRCPICLSEFVAPERVATLWVEDRSVQDDKNHQKKEPEPSEEDRSRSAAPKHLSCPTCGCREEPTTTKRISQAGWIVFAVLLVTFWPLFWIGLLINEEVKQCRRCKRYIATA
jgi:hypothetical protein